MLIDNIVTSWIPLLINIFKYWIFYYYLLLFQLSLIVHVLIVCDHVNYQLQSQCRTINLFVNTMIIIIYIPFHYILLFVLVKVIFCFCCSTYYYIYSNSSNCVSIIHIPVYNLNCVGFQFRCCICSVCVFISWIVRC